MSGGDWLDVRRGTAPLIVSMPHTGTDIPADIERDLTSPWIARKDTDWWIDRLYAFAADLGATIVRTPLSRTVIDVNRDPGGASLYPGQTTTALCPVTTFDGEALYTGAPPGEEEIDRRRTLYFEPYHRALADEIDRLRAGHPRIVLYEAHSIRSRVPRLFDGELPQFNIGTHSGASCDTGLEAAVAAACTATGFSHVVNGRFKGGWTTRHYGRPEQDVHAIQMELACRGYMAEPDVIEESSWPSPFDPAIAAPMTTALTGILQSCLTFARS